jgi:hypothetical protein
MVHHIALVYCRAPEVDWMIADELKKGRVNPRFNDVTKVSLFCYCYTVTTVVLLVVPGTGTVRL